MGYLGTGCQNPKIHLGIILCPKLMILHGVRRLIPYLGVCHANEPKKWEYTTPVLELYLTTSLRGDLSPNPCLMMHYNWHRIQLAPRLIRSLRPLSLRQGRGSYKGAYTHWVRTKFTSPPCTVFFLVPLVPSWGQMWSGPPHSRGGGGGSKSGCLPWPTKQHQNIHHVKHELINKMFSQNGT